MKNWGVFFSLMFFVLSCQKNNEMKPVFSNNWSIGNRHKLSEIISENANMGKSAIFDFDNTTLCRDIGEATMAQLEIDGLLIFSDSLAAISPKLNNEAQRSVSGYYDALLNLEPNSHTNAYLWAAQSMMGLNLRLIIEATKKVMDRGETDSVQNQAEAIMVGAFPVPYIYSEMAELYAALLQNGIEPYIISASNIWSVRYTVLNYLNPKIAAKSNKELKIKPENVFGIHFWLRDKRDNKLYKDDFLLKTNELYAQMNPQELENYIITNLPVLPITAYGGKVALIYEEIGNKTPLLVAGDSPNDFLMLSTAEYKLWIARMEKPSYHEEFLKLGFLPDNVLIQPVINSNMSGFYADKLMLTTKLSGQSKWSKVSESIKILQL